MISKQELKSCCGKKTIILESDRPIRKFQLSVFEGAGYTAPQSFKDIGIFYVRNNDIIATASFGSKRINVRCVSTPCDDKIIEFMSLLEKAVSIKI